ncbi:LLM class flavin-dependent oxidoreductase [Haladaptatus cibarius]|uniref:LLM class flavin-dependent oxidoreductase n=1 Tax=Haladaptatus cibarius TaxID=453847 RepID=UPI00067844FD|nr:LLM class flavin-dependent oxidoreductase [Haladaptatus cibarius]
MAQFGVANEGMPDYPLKKLENGYVVPDVSVAEIHRTHQRQTGNQVEYAVLADKLGYDYVLQPERHFTLLGPVSPNQLLIHTAVAARTENVRLLQMANNLPWSEPVRLAEQTAMLDIISDGRAEIGIGRGSDPRTTAIFGQYWGGSKRNFMKDQRSFEEKYELLLKAWTEEFVTHHGEFHHVPPSYTEWENNQEYHYLMDEASESDPSEYMQVNVGTGKTTLKSVPVMPQPIQKPHPQLWKPAASEGSVKWAARHGVNGCTFGNSFSGVKKRIDQYYDAAEAAGWPDHRPEYDGEPWRRGWDAERNRGMVGMLGVFNTEVASEETFERWKLGQEFNLSNIKGMKPPEQAKNFTIDAEAMLEEGDAPIVGGSEEIIEGLVEYRDVCGYKDFIVIPLMKAVGMTHDESVTQLRAFAEDVMPYFEEQSAT